MNRTAPETESAIVKLRLELATVSDLGEFGAEAIHAVMIERQFTSVPSIRTIGRILLRNGALDGNQRIRRPAPPPGWYLPELAAGSAELDSFDTVVGLLLRGGLDVDVLNGISIHGGLISSWPRTSITSTVAVELLTSRWREFGPPTYAQFDNDNVFQGPHQYADVVSQVIRLCLLLGVTPVFAPPREHGFQNAVESLNGRWQAKVWSRLHHESLLDVQQQTERWVLAVRRRAGPRMERAPTRSSFPLDVSLDLRSHPVGTVIFIRRTDDVGGVSVLGPSLPNRFPLASTPRSLRSRSHPRMHPFLCSPSPRTDRSTAPGGGRLRLPPSTFQTVLINTGTQLLSVAMVDHDYWHPVAVMCPQWR